MSHPFVPQVGAVISADIAVPEHERVVHFYSRVLTTGNSPLWNKDLTNNQGTPVIGLGPTSEQYADIPLQWMPHIQVADVATSAERAQALGGRELMHGKDNDGNSQWAVLMDPNGAAFGIIPVVPESAIPPPAGTPEPVGHIAWLDLTVTDASTTRTFYEQVVGWAVQEVGMKDTDEDYADFNMLGANGKPVAGICHARGVNQGLPPVWMMYLPVGDLEESLRRVEEEGGKTIHTRHREAMGNTNMQ